jgi:type I restriction enzyme S subunit
MTRAWTPIALGDDDLLVEMQPGYACGKKDVVGGVVHLRMNNVTKDGALDMTLMRRIPPEFAMKQGRFAKKDDVIFVNTNSTELVGKSCVFPGWDEPCAFSNHLTKLRTNPEKLHPLWLHLCLRKLWHEGYFATHCIEFIGQSTFNREQLRELEIPVPPLPEQRRLVGRIEALTGRLEQAREARQTGLAESETMKQAVWDRAFANVPEDRWVPIGKHARVQGGYAFKSEWFVAEGIRLVRNQNVYHGTLEWSDTVHLQPDRCGEFADFELREGDVVISMDRPLIKTGLKAARFSKADLPCLLLQRVGRFLCDDELDRGYLLHFLFSQSFIPHISGDGRSCAVPHISAKQIEAIAMPLPKREEQGRIVEHLDAVQAKLDELQRLQREVEAELAAFTPALLAKAFRGEL